jgi:hypothetical protein
MPGATCGTGVLRCVDGVLVDTCVPAPAAPEICDGADNDCDGLVDEGACVTATITALRHDAGPGTAPSIHTTPLPGTDVAAFDRSAGSCAGTIGIAPVNYARIFFGSESPPAPPCPRVASGRTDASGRVTLALPPGDYLVIGRPAPPHPDTLIGSPLGSVSAGQTVQRTLRLIVTANGSAIPARTQRFTGSELLVVEPELVVWDSAIESYPIIFESDSAWSVSVSIDPPEGLVADHETLSASVEGATAAVQFTLADIATEFTPVALAYSVAHDGARQTLTSLVETLARRLDDPDRITITRCEAVAFSARRGRRSHALTLEATSDRQPDVALGAVDVSGPGSLRLLGLLPWAGSDYEATFMVRNAPSLVLVVSSRWGFALCAPTSP